jgi:hypothetical protein
MLLALGSYPEVSLKEARMSRDAARADLVHGIDPAVRRKCEKASAADTFQAAAHEPFTILRKASLAGEEPPATAAEVVERTISPRRKRRARRREPISAEAIDSVTVAGLQDKPASGTLTTFV